MEVRPDRLAQFSGLAAGWVSVPSDAEALAQGVVDAAFARVDDAFAARKLPVPPSLTKLMEHTRDMMGRRIGAALKKCRPRVVGKKRKRIGVLPHVAEERLAAVVAAQTAIMERRLRKFSLSPEETFIALDIEFIGDRVEMGILKIIR